MKTVPYSDDSGWLIFCPACGNGHKFDKGRWTFNGNPEKPTFNPSMLVKCPAWPDIEANGWLTYHTEGTTSYRVPIVTVGRDCPTTIEGVAKSLSVPATLEAVSQRVREILDSLPPAVCHSFVRDGQIQFLSDCTHSMAGQTVDLPDV